MGRHSSERMLASGLALVIIVSVFAARLLRPADTEFSPLIADADIPKALHNQVLPSGYRVLVRDDRWSLDTDAGTSERTLECTVVRLDNLQIDRDVVRSSLDSWIAKLVAVEAESDDAVSPVSLSHALQYRDGNVIGEVRYTINALPAAIKTINETESNSSHESLTIHVSEQAG